MNTELLRETSAVLHGLMDFFAITMIAVVIYFLFLFIRAKGRTHKIINILFAIIIGVLMILVIVFYQNIAAADALLAMVSN